MGDLNAVEAEAIQLYDCRAILTTRPRRGDVACGFGLFPDDEPKPQVVIFRKIKVHVDYSGGLSIQLWNAGSGSPTKKPHARLSYRGHYQIVWK